MDTDGLFLYAFAALPVVYLGLTEGWASPWTIFVAVTMFGGVTFVLLAPAFSA